MRDSSAIQPMLSDQAPPAADKRWTPRDRRNVSLTAVGEGTWGFAYFLTMPATVLTALLTSHGAGERMIGGITAAETACSILPQVLGVYLFYSKRRRKAQLVAWHIYAAIPFIFGIGLVSLLSDRLGPVATRWLALGSYAMFQLAIGVIMAVWMDWLAHLYATRIRGMAMGITFGAAALAGILGSRAAGRIIGEQPTPEVFAGLYMAAGVLSVVSILIFAFVDDPARTDPTDSSRPVTSELLRRFRQSLGDHNFRSFLIGRMLATFGFCMLPFIYRYYTSAQGGGLTPGFVVAAGAALPVGTAVAHLVLGRLGDRFGHRLGVLLGISVQTLTLVVLLTTSGPVSCYGAYLLAGFCSAAGFLSHYNLMFETCPHDHRLAHITVGNLVMSPVNIAAPLLAGVLAKETGLAGLFAVSLGFSVVALTWFVLRVKEPRQIVAFPLS